MKVWEMPAGAVLGAAQLIARVGKLSRLPFAHGAGETWAAELDGLFVIVDSLSFEVRLSEVRDFRKTGLEGLKVSLELASTWRIVEGAAALDARASLLLRHAAAGTFVAPGHGWDLERFRSELLAPLLLEVA